MARTGGQLSVSWEGGGVMGGGLRQAEILSEKLQNLSGQVPGLVWGTPARPSPCFVRRSIGTLQLRDVGIVTPCCLYTVQGGGRSYSMLTERKIGVQRNVHIPRSSNQRLPSSLRGPGAGDGAGEGPGPSPCSHGAPSPVGGRFRWTGDEPAAPARCHHSWITQHGEAMSSAGAAGS